MLRCEDGLSYSYTMLSRTRCKIIAEGAVWEIYRDDTGILSFFDSFGVVWYGWYFWYVKQDQYR